MVRFSSIFGGVAGAVRDHHHVVRAVVPAEGRNAVDDAVQDPHLARRRGGGKLRRPLVQRVRAAADPPRESGTALSASNTFVASPSRRRTILNSSALKPGLGVNLTSVRVLQ